MPPYSFKFDFSVNDKVRDLLTGEYAVILGVSYINGKNASNNVTYFHAVAVYIQFENGVFDIRSEENLELI